MKKVNSNEKIIEYRKIIANDYNKIKSQLNICKTKYGENTEKYNSLINNINEKIKNKENIDKIHNLKLKDLEIKSNNSENIYKFSVNSYSYEDEEKNSYNKTTNRNLNNNTNMHSSTEEKFYNLDISANRFNNNNINTYTNKNLNNNPINLLKACKEKRSINVFSSNKLQKHTNYIDKYFNTNSNKDNNSNNEEKSNNCYSVNKTNYKSSTQLNFYPSFRPISKLSIATPKKNYINNNLYNTRFSYQNNSTRINSLLDKYSKNIPYYDICQSQNKNQKILLKPQIELWALFERITCHIIIIILKKNWIFIIRKATKVRMNYPKQ